MDQLPAPDEETKKAADSAPGTFTEALTATTPLAAVPLPKTKAEEKEAPTVGEITAITTPAADPGSLPALKHEGGDQTEVLKGETRAVSAADTTGREDVTTTRSTHPTLIITVNDLPSTGTTSPLPNTSSEEATFVLASPAIAVASGKAW